MNFKKCLCIVSALFCNTSFSQLVEPIVFENNSQTKINQEHLYSEFDGLFDSFIEGCYSRRIGSRSPFINLLKSAINKSGASYSDKTIKRSDRKCSNYIEEDISFTFEHYYRHYCGLTYLKNSDNLSLTENKGMTVAEEYYSDLIEACDVSSKKSIVWFNEWTTALNVWSELLTNKVNLEFELRAIAQEKLRIQELESKKKAENEARIAAANRLRENEERKLRLIAVAKQAEVEKLKLMAKTSIKQPDKNASVVSGNTTIESSTISVKDESKPANPPKKIIVNINELLSKSEIYHELYDLPDNNIGAFGLSYGETQNNPRCELSGFKSSGDVFYCEIKLNNERKYVDVYKDYILLPYGLHYHSQTNNGSGTLKNIVNKLQQSKNLNHVLVEGSFEIKACFDNCRVEVTKYFDPRLAGQDLFITFNRDDKAKEILMKNTKAIKAILEKESAVKNSKNYDL